MEKENDLIKSILERMLTDIGMKIVSKWNINTKGYILSRTENRDHFIAVRDFNCLDSSLFRYVGYLFDTPILTIDLHISVILNSPENNKFLLNTPLQTLRDTDTWIGASTELIPEQLYYSWTTNINGFSQGVSIIDPLFTNKQVIFNTSYCCDVIDLGDPRTRNATIEELEDDSWWCQ